MATKRRTTGTKSRANQPKRQAKAGVSRRAGTSTRKRKAGARHARPAEAASIATATTATPVAHVEWGDGEERGRAAAPALRVAEPPPVEHDADWGGEGSEAAGGNGSATSWGTGESHHTAEDRDAAELARRIEEAAGSAVDDLRLRADEAARELGLRRERDERDADAQRMEDQRGVLPGIWALGVELAVGAFRIARAVATAPLRIGLALLRH